jgi:hypothetical protein
MHMNGPKCVKIVDPQTGVVEYIIDRIALGGYAEASENAIHSTVDCYFKVEKDQPYLVTKELEKEWEIPVITVLAEVSPYRAYIPHSFRFYPKLFGSQQLEEIEHTVEKVIRKGVLISKKTKVLDWETEVYLLSRESLEEIIEIATNAGVRPNCKALIAASEMYGRFARFEDILSLRRKKESCKQLIDRLRPVKS